MKKIFKLMMVLVAGLVLVSCGGNDKSNEVKTKELLIGTNAEYKPYEYMEGDKIVGFDIDFMEEIAKSLGYTIKWKNMSFEGLVPALQGKKVDLVIAGMTPTEERMKNVDFTQVYYSSKQSVLTLDSAMVENIDDLKGAKIGVQLGTLQEGIAGGIEGTEVKRYNSFTGAVLDLKQDKIDAVIVGSVVAKPYLDNNPELKLAFNIDDSSDGSAIALRKGQEELLEELNKAIDDIKESGKYQELVSKYFNN